jgi:hypothetical protein
MVSVHDLEPGLPHPMPSRRVLGASLHLNRFKAPIILPSCCTDLHLAFSAFDLLSRRIDCVG